VHVFTIWGWCELEAEDECFVGAKSVVTHSHTMLSFLFLYLMLVFVNACPSLTNTMEKHGCVVGNAHGILARADRQGLNSSALGVSSLIGRIQSCALATEGEDSSKTLPACEDRVATNSGAAFAW
jgi:hypothetical protein